MCDYCKRNFDAIAYALEADIADFVREEINLTYRIDWKVKRRQRRSHLRDALKIEMVNRLATEIRQIAA